MVVWREWSDVGIIVVVSFHLVVGWCSEDGSWRRLVHIELRRWTCLVVEMMTLVESMLPVCWVEWNAE